MTTAATAHFGYAMLKSGPEVSPGEVESHRTATEVVIMWGKNALSIVHLAPSRSYYVGEDGGRCDYFVPSEVLGAASAPLVESRNGVAHLVIPRGALGYVDVPGAERVTFAALVASGRAAPSGEGLHEYELPVEAKARVEFEGSDLAFQINAIHAGKRLPRRWLARAEPAEILYPGLSFVLHAGLLAALAFLMPHMRGEDGEAIDADRILMMQKLLNASAEREQTTRELPAVEGASAQPRSGSGASPRGEGGAMGTAFAKEANHRYAVRGPSDNADVHLARLRALDEASTFAAISMLAAMAGGDPNAPTAWWGREESSGRDATSALGRVLGDTIGDAIGAGGLDLSGVGEGGHGPSDSIGLNDLGNDLGRGRGPGNDQGIGVGRGRPNRGHQVRQIGMRDGSPSVNGRIPAEVIQRIVHQNFGRFRLCYENGMRLNPTLEGRVTVKFAIDRTGAVAMSSDGGSDLPDQGVVQCVVRAFANVSFPAPEGGLVTVVYPIAFSPGEREP